MSVLSLKIESQVGFPALKVAGADEVGRGCLAGPVVAGAVVLPTKISLDRHPWLVEVKDSKLLSPASRSYLAPLITQWALACAIGVASVQEIDELNIFHATHLAIVRAVHQLGVSVHHLLVDGKFLPRQKLLMPATAVIRGDQKCLSIAAASIVAKVWRDQQMVQLDQEFPGYGLAQHKGYPTPQHKKAILQHGRLPIHRRSFQVRT